MGTKSSGSAEQQEHCKPFAELINCNWSVSFVGVNTGDNSSSAPITVWNRNRSLQRFFQCREREDDAVLRGRPEGSAVRKTRRQACGSQPPAYKSKVSGHPPHLEGESFQLSDSQQ